MDLFKKMLGSTVGAQPLVFVGGATFAFVGLTGSKVLSLTGLTGGLASSPSQGDIVIVGGCTCHLTNNMLATGYTSIATKTANDAYDSNMTAAYKIMGETPDTTFELPNGTGGTTYAGGATVQVWRNPNEGDLFDVTHTSTSTESTAKVNPNSITPVTEGAIVLALGTAGHAAGVATFTSSDLTNFLTSGASDTLDVSVGSGYIAYVGSTINPVQWGFTGTDMLTYSNVSVCIALKPQ